MNPMPVIPAELHWLWSATWQAAVLVALVLLIQGLGRNLLSPSSRFVLWWLVLIRLSLPVTPESAWSLFNLAPQRATPVAPTHIVSDRAIPEPRLAAGAPTEFVPAASSQAWTASIDPAPAVSSASIAIAGAAGNWTIHEPHDSVAAVGASLFWIWLIGAALYGGRILTASLLLGRHLRRQPPLREPAIERLLNECRQQMGIRRQIDMIETARVGSPALFGLVRPRLLIPPGFLRAFTETELRHVLLHELAHLRRRDLWLNWWMVWIQAVHWFNPLVWLLLARIRSDRELACDALAMTKTEPPDRATYGRTVLKLLEQLAVPSPVPGSVGVLEDRRAIERRVQSIIRFRPHQRFPWAVAALWIALAGVTLTDGRPVPADEAGTTPSEQQLPSASVAGEDRASMLARDTEIDREYRQGIVAAPVQPAEELIDEIRTSDFANGIVESALGVLKTQVDRTRRELPVGLINEFEQSLASRLKAIQENADQISRPELKSTWTAKRILELAEQVLRLPYRDIPDDVQERQKARQQYAAASERFERLARAEPSGLPESFQAIIKGALRPVLTSVGQDMFRPAYGRPLSEAEVAELDRVVVDRMLEVLSTLPRPPEDEAVRFRTVPRVVIIHAWSAVGEFLRNREADPERDPSLLAAISAWRTEIAEIELAVDQALEHAVMAEIEATGTRITEQPANDIRENDPRTIAEPIRQPEERAIQEINNPNGDVSTGEDSTDHPSRSEPAATGLRSPFQMRLVERTAGADTEPMTLTRRASNREETVEEILHVRRDALLDHTAIASATAQPYPPDPWGNPLIQVQLTEAGAQRFAEVTRANIGRLLAVVVDGRLLTAPRIAQEIRGRRMQIGGSFSAEEAAELAGIINAAVILAHPLTPVEAGHLAHPTANTPQANDTLSVAGNHPPTLRWLIQPGSQSLLRIEGTSSMHDWLVESRMMEGYIELGADALTAVSRAPMERIPLKAKLQIPVRSLKSVGANGKAFSAAMDEVMYHLLRETINPEIVYTLTESIVAGGPDGLAPWRLDTKGNLVVAGVKKEIATTAKITFAADELRFRIETRLKMSDFNVDPPVVKTLDGAVQLAYDEVTITLEGTATTVTTP